MAYSSYKEFATSVAFIWFLLVIITGTLLLLKILAICLPTPPVPPVTIAQFLLGSVFSIVKVGKRGVFKSVVCI